MGRRRDLKLAEYRVWLAEQSESEALVADHGAASMATVASAHASACAALDGLDAGLDDLDPGELDGDALMATVLALESTRRSLDAANARLLARLDASGVTEASSGLGAKQWKANRTHASPAVVARELKVARTLARFAVMAGALAAGDVSAEHVAALARVCNERTTDALVEHENAIVSFAKIHRFNLYVTYLRRLVAMIDTDGAEPDCGDVDTATMTRDFDGNLRLFMELSGHNALEAKAIINTETDRQFRAAQREHEATGTQIPSMAVLRARAVMELLRRGADPDGRSATPVASVVLAVQGDRHGNPSTVATVDGDPVDPLTTAVLACDAHFHRVVVDPSNNPLNMGRSVRLFTPAQRHALTLRDGGCIFPGCEQPARRCAAHHRIEWSHGGKTDIDDGAMLCPRHHGLMHCERPWILLRYDISELPADLLAAHRVRATSVGLEPSGDVRVFRSPGGRLFLAQNAADHHGPAPPRGPTT